MQFRSIYNKFAIWVKPPKVRYDVMGNIIIEEPGKIIEFNNGIFNTEDEELIKFLKDYMTKNPGKVFTIEEEKVKKVKENLGKE